MWTPPPAVVTSTVVNQLSVHDAEPRRRTKKACLTCQRKKLKCSGLQPCIACSSRSTHCTYADHPRDIARNHAKQQHRARNPSTQVYGRVRPLPGSIPPLWTSQSRVERSIRTESKSMSLRGPSPVGDRSPATAGDILETTFGEQSEGQSLQEQLRMLQDGKGRLLYLGDSASLSYLDTIRRLVESVTGPCGFTNDVNKNKLVEGSLSTELKPTFALPDKEAANFLLESFFSNTVGVINIFDREVFTQECESIYNKPLQATQSQLSMLNLVFAVGLQLVRSSAGLSPHERQILERLEGGGVNRAERFFVNAKCLNPVLEFEDGDITSVQALLLVTMFMLNTAKRNAAWSYVGMAVRTAYAIGLHRKRADITFNLTEQRVRRNVWRSLYVMDCFVSTMLGRPNSITCRDATESFVAGCNSGDNSDPSDDALELASISASAHASCLVGNILSTIYADRRISTKLAHAISNKYQVWKDTLPSFLHWQNIDLPDENIKMTLAQLHVSLNYFHGIILLTRPFLLQRVSEEVRTLKRAQANNILQQTDEIPATNTAQTAPFSEACVRAALYTINAVQAALLKRALPRQDPFVLHWLFSAALIICTNGFCPIYNDINNEHTLYTVINLHHYFGKVDPLARRFLEILLAFKEAIAQGGIPCAVQVTQKSKREHTLSALFTAVPHDTATGVVNSQSQPRTEFGSRPSIAHGGDLGEVGLQPERVQTSAQQSSFELNAPAISPLDYTLDFDAFLANFAQDLTYQQDLWTPLYGIANPE